MDPEVATNRVAWEAGSQKHVREYALLLQQASDQRSLTEHELTVLRPLLQSRPDAVHLQSGHGLADIASTGPTAHLRRDLSRRARLRCLAA